MASQTLKLRLEDYPSCDGMPMANNTEHYDEIVRIHGNLASRFRDDPNVVVVADVLWYPLEDNTTVCVAPDVMVIFGRPKGPRPSWVQCLEEGVGPQVVFEVLSESNTVSEMAGKMEFFETHGVQEYYLYDLDKKVLQVFLRKGTALPRKRGIDHSGFSSPLLGIHLKIENDELVLTGPEGDFLGFVENVEGRIQQTRRADQAERRAEQERLRAEKEYSRAEEETRRAEEERQRAEEERLRADALAEQIRQMQELLRSRGIDPDPPA